MTVSYHLIDGGFLFATVARLRRKYHSPDPLEIDFRSFLSSDVHRVIYYDALPAKRNSDTQDEFQRKFNEKLDFINSLRELPRFHVRDGYTKLRASSATALEQKGVDTWIAVEGMQIALTGLADEIHVYTNDLDLYPLFEAITQTKTIGTLRYDPARTAKELVYSADHAIPLTDHEIISLLTSESKSSVFQNIERRGDNWHALEKFFIVDSTKYGEFFLGWNPEINMFQGGFENNGNRFQSAYPDSIIHLASADLRIELPNPIIPEEYKAYLPT